MLFYFNMIQNGIILPLYNTLKNKAFQLFNIKNIFNLL